MTQTKQTTRRNRRPLVFDKITIILLIAFLVMSIITAVAVFNLAKNIISTWSMTNLAGLPVPPKGGNSAGAANSTPVPMPEGALQPVGGPTAEPWDGVSRITVLLMGLDYRDWEAGETPRTDTMMLLSMDPLSQTAAVMSIPRDMWVNIPGFDYAKINTAYYLGEVYDLPGGGPGLAVETVEQFLGVPINYYAQIDFQAFVRFIDEIKGVKVTPDMDVTIVPIGGGMKQHLKAGETVTLPGDLALGYARARYTEGGDFDRAKRQQEVIFAIRDRVLNFSMLPSLIIKAPVLYQEIAAGIKTNLEMDQVLRLATSAIAIDRSKIKNYVIDSTCVEFGKSADGLDILIPIPDKIRLLRDEAFTTGGPVGPAAINTSGDATEITSLVKAENARVSVQNGSWMTGLAATTSAYLKTKDFNVVEETNGELTSITTIYLYNGKPNTVQAIFDMFEAAGLPTPRLFNQTDLSAQLDMAIVLGDDWANYVYNNPLPTQ